MTDSERLYQLLPAVYRIRDKEHNEALRALLAVIEAEVRSLEDDIEGLYADWFIETCAEWVVPYIGDLLGVRGLHAGSPRAYSLRPYVAHTLAYRRRKGTATVLEQLARDITGWTARVVEYFDLLAGTQHVNHVRPGKARTCDLQRSAALTLIGAPFDSLAHTVEVRLADSGRGRYNLPNLGIHLWRLSSYYLSRSPARAVTGGPAGSYTFSPLGCDLPLFNRPKTEAELTHLAEEVNVPGRLRREPLHRELAQRRRAILRNETPSTAYFDNQPPFRIYLGGSEIPVLPDEIVIGDLSQWDRTPGFLPTGREFSSGEENEAGSAAISPVQATVAVDPELGRLLIPPVDGTTGDPEIQVSYAYGFSGDIGGGPYDRGETLASGSATVWSATVRSSAALEDTTKGVYQDIQLALDAWRLVGPDKHQAVITIVDNGSYQLGSVPSPSGDESSECTLELNPGDELVIQAANKCRPVIRCVDAQGEVTALVIKAIGTGNENTLLTLSGLLVEGGLRIEHNCLQELRLIHTTLVPGLALELNGEPAYPDQPSITATAYKVALRVRIEDSIVGPLALPEDIAGLSISESIVDAGPAGLKAIGLVSEEIYGPCTTIERATILGEVRVRELALASDSIFEGAVTLKKRQAGFARFSYLPPDTFPKQFRCQPQLALKEQETDAESGDGTESNGERNRIIHRLQVGFTSRRYGRPGYGQLAASSPLEIRTGAENGSEMGAFNFLLPAQREANLRLALDDYLPFGLEAGIYYVT